MESVDISCADLGHLYLELHHDFHRLVDEAMTEAGLSLSRTKVLKVLAEEGPLKQAAVAQRLGFAPRSVTDALDALERDGLATRRMAPHDRRAWLVEITASGSTALDHALAVKKHAMNTIFGGLDAQERDRFAALLVSIRTRIDSRTEEAHVPL